MTQVNPGANDGPQPPPSEEDELRSRENSVEETEPTRDPGRDHERR
jgi:hypothetical protein